jgi:hypothetical protein
MRERREDGDGLERSVRTWSTWWAPAIIFAVKLYNTRFRPLFNKLTKALSVVVCVCFEALADRGVATVGPFLVCLWATWLSSPSLSLSRTRYLFVPL